MLQIRSLTVSYGPTQAVRGIDLHVGVGEAVALLGPNGAGKTSTLRAISGVVPHGGSVVFDGADLRRRDAASIARSGLIHVPEGRHVFPTLTVHENLQMGQLAAGGRTPAYGYDEVYDLLPKLAPLRNRLGYALSGGEQQMVAIGRALLAAPRLLLLDEPSLGLAPAVVHDVFRTLAEVVRNTPVLVVEQNTVEALRLCNRAYVMVKGDIATQGSAAQLRDREALLAKFLGQRDTAAAAAHLVPE